MTSEVLICARALITDPESWCGDGWGTGDRMCALHAIHDAYEMVDGSCPDFPSLTEAGIALERAVGAEYDHLGDWNDVTPHEGVLAGFDRAILDQRAREQEFNAAACEPVAFDRWTAADVAEVLGEPYDTGWIDQAAWERAWKDMEK